MEHNTLESITKHIGALNRALGHRRGVVRVTLDTATAAQRPLVEELVAWNEAHQYRLNLDSACARARILEEQRQQAGDNTP